MLFDYAGAFLWIRKLPVGAFSEAPSVSKFRINLCDIDPESIKINTYDLHKSVFSCADAEQVKLYELNCDSGEVEFLARNGSTAFSEERVQTFTKLTERATS